MNSEIAQIASPPGHFTALLSATPRGARLARRLVVQQLMEWGHPYGPAEQVVAELANNAVLHGHVPGRDFRLTIRLLGAGTLRIAVTDTRGDRLPPPGVPELPPTEAESGRGLLIVEALAQRWGTELGPAPRKTVWAEIDQLART